MSRSSVTAVACAHLDRFSTLLFLLLLQLLLLSRVVMIWSSFSVFCFSLRLVEGMDFSLVVFDTAPTGHTLRLLSFPSLLDKALSKILSLKNKFRGVFSQVCTRQIPLILHSFTLFGSSFPFPSSFLLSAFPSFILPSTVSFSRSAFLFFSSPSVSSSSRSHSLRTLPPSPISLFSFTSSSFCCCSSSLTRSDFQLSGVAAVFSSSLSSFLSSEEPLFSSSFSSL